MTSLLAQVLEQFQNYFADSLYPLLFVLCLAVIFFHPAAKEERGALVGSNLLFLAITFCPLSAYIIMKMIGSLVYWRMFWMLTIPIVIAFAGVELIVAFSKKAMRVLTALLAAAAIAFSGQFLFTGTYFSSQANYFKIPTDAIYVAEVISEHAAEQGIESPKAAVTAVLSIYIRQYDASIRLAYGRNMVKGDVSPSELYEEINSASPRARQLALLAQKNECSYLVLPTSLDLDEALAKYSYEKVGEAGNYTVYFCNFQ